MAVIRLTQLTSIDLVQSVADMLRKIVWQVIPALV